MKVFRLQFCVAQNIDATAAVLVAMTLEDPLLRPSQKRLRSHIPALLLLLLLLHTGGCRALMFQSHIVSKQWDTWAFLVGTDAHPKAPTPRPFSSPPLPLPCNGRQPCVTHVTVLAIPQLALQPCRLSTEHPLCPFVPYSRPHHKCSDKAHSSTTD